MLGMLDERKTSIALIIVKPCNNRLGLNTAEANSCSIGSCKSGKGVTLGCTCAKLDA